MTYAEHISNLRHALKEVSDESDYSDSLLYSKWMQGRAYFLGQKAKKQDHIQPTNYHQFCMELEVGKSHDCSCVPVGCQVLKSKYPVPSVIASRVRDHLEIMTLDGQTIAYKTEREKKTDQLDDIKKDKYGYMILNQKLIIWDDQLNLKAVQVKGLFSNPLEWQEIQLCTSTNPCVDVYSMISGLSNDDEALIIDYVKRAMREELTRPADVSMDSNPEIR